LLTDDGVAGTCTRQGPANRLFGRLVGVGDGGAVGFAFDPQIVGPKARRGLRVRIVGENVREPEVVVIGHGWSTYTVRRGWRSHAAERLGISRRPDAHGWPAAVGTSRPCPGRGARRPARCRAR